MSNVLVFDTVAPKPATPAWLRLRRLSRVLAILFTILMGLAVLWVLWLSVLIIFFDDHLNVGAENIRVTFPEPAQAIAGRVVLASQPFITHLAGIVNVLIATTPVALICWHLRGLFRLYAAGVVFARENAGHLKRVGLWLVIYPFAKFTANMIFQLAGGMDKAWFRIDLVYALILGATVFAIAQVMEFGHEIEQDQAEII